ncbi:MULTISPECIES: hypothetical protein [Bacillus]|uniref:hypothetical protein n=1 Tax=Bacillus TaxID=1386 RepID=UPI0002E06933|nr:MULTISPECIES: hypothetical protein [Bacillus]
MLREMKVGITFNDHASRQLNRIDRIMDEAGREARDLASAVKDAEHGFGSFGRVAAGLGGMIAGVFAVDKIKDFGISAVESAATAQATTAQFGQVFGGLQDNAESMVDGLGDSFGMVSERIKPAFTQTTSMFKGLGLSTKDAMEQAESAVNLAADAAAFYDKSYEDANSSLNSFIKGNYEGGESIGLFANETQLASWAAQNLNLDWKKLGEADKQMARLQFAESMQKAAGATGQASRESESYENQLGNLRQSWTNLKAGLAGPFLDKVTAGLKNMATWVGNVDTEKLTTGMSSFGEKVSTVVTPAFNGLKTGLGWVKDNAGLVTTSLTAVVGGFAAFKGVMAVNTAIQAYNGFMKTSAVVTGIQTIATHGLNAAIRANPFGWVATLIGLVVTAGILLYKNWDTVKIKAGELWAKTKEVFGGIYDWGVSKIQPVVNFFGNLADKFSKFKNAITSFKMPKWVSTIGSTIGKAAGLALPGHATGLASVPYDNYAARLHKDESVLTAKQSTALRDAGILKSNADGTPTLDMQASNSSQVSGPIVQGTSGTTISQVFHINVNGTDDTATDIKEVVRRSWNEMWDSFARTNPQVTER